MTSNNEENQKQDASTFCPSGVSLQQSPEDPKFAQEIEAARNKDGDFWFKPRQQSAPTTLLFDKEPRYGGSSSPGQDGSVKVPEMSQAMWYKDSPTAAERASILECIGDSHPWFVNG
jgi:hypothetical protein